MTAKDFANAHRAKLEGIRDFGIQVAHDALNALDPVPDEAADSLYYLEEDMWKLRVMCHDLFTAACAAGVITQSVPSDDEREQEQQEATGAVASAYLLGMKTAETLGSVNG